MQNNKLTQRRLIFLARSYWRSEFKKEPAVGSEVSWVIWL